MRKKVSIIAGAVLVASVAAGVFLSSKGSRQSGLTEAQQAHLKFVNDTVSARQLTMFGEAQLEFERLFLDAMLTHEDLSAQLAISARHEPIDKAFLRKKAEPGMTSAELERQLNILRRCDHGLSWAVWAGLKMPMEAGIRERIITELIRALDAATQPHERVQCFISLATSGAFVDLAVKERAVAILTADPDLGSVQYISAWKEAEKERKRASQLR